ncbi:unnamed protein product, partial [Scytosiphon promiscuus]
MGGHQTRRVENGSRTMREQQIVCAGDLCWKETIKSRYAPMGSWPLWDVNRSYTNAAERTRCRKTKARQHDGACIRGSKRVPLGPGSAGPHGCTYARDHGFVITAQPWMQKSTRRRMGSELQRVRRKSFLSTQ